MPECDLCWAPFENEAELAKHSAVTPCLAERPNGPDVDVES